MAPDDKVAKAAKDDRSSGRGDSKSNSLRRDGRANRSSSPTPSPSPEPPPPPPSQKPSSPPPTTSFKTTRTNGTSSAGTEEQGSGQQQRKKEQQRERHESGESDVSTESYENYIPSPPDGGWGWVIVASSLFCNLIVDGLGYSFGVFLLEFSHYFQESKSKVSLVGSLLCGVYLFAGPVVSAMTNKLGCRPVAVMGSVVAALAFLLSTMAPSVDILILTYGVLGGFGLGMIYLPSIVSVGYYFEKKRALATGIAVCGSGIGTFIFAPLSEYLLEEMDWKNALMIISGITLNGAVCGMLMRPLEPGRPKHRPRAKNLLDRIKEQAKGNRNRTCSENSTNAYSVHDTNAVLERVMEAKLLREKRLQEDESELGSLPSIFLVRQQSHKDSKDPRLHKLSFSDRGDAGSSQLEDSPLGSMPKIPSSSLAPTSLPILVEASHATPSAAAASSPGTRDGQPVSPANPEGSSANEVSQSSATDAGYGTAEASHSTENRKSAPASASASTSPSASTSASAGNERERAGEDKAGQSPDRGPGSSKGEEMTASDTFVDAESGTFGDGTNTERSDYVTPPTSPPDTCSPTTPEREGERGTGGATDLMDSPKNGSGKRISDPAVAKLVARSGKELKNGSVPSNIHHHVHEVVPLLQVPDRKTTLVNLGSEKNMWRLKNVQTPVRPCGQSLLSLSVSKKDLARPLYRKDIFYSGSVHNLPLFRSQPDMKSYITSITTIPGETALVAGGEAKVWRYLQCFPQSCKDTLQEMLDLSLLKDLGFLLICLGNVLAFLGFYVPFVYCVDLAVSLDIDKADAAFLISIIGIANTVGRVVTGWLADLRRINSLVITYVSIFVCGISTALFPFCKSYGLLCAAASLFGLSVAAFISLSSILICDLLGLEKLTNGFGLMSLFRGIAAMAGPPLAGFMYDQTSSYDVSFFLGGALLTLGALCHLSLKLPCVHKREPEVFVEAISVEEMPVVVGSGVKPELVTLEEVMTRV